MIAEVITDLNNFATLRDALFSKMPPDTNTYIALRGTLAIAQFREITRDACVPMSDIYRGHSVSEIAEIQFLPANRHRSAAPVIGALMGFEVLMVLKEPTPQEIFDAASARMMELAEDDGKGRMVLTPDGWIKTVPKWSA